MAHNSNNYDLGADNVFIVPRTTGTIPSFLNERLNWKTDEINFTPYNSPNTSLKGTALEIEADSVDTDEIRALNENGLALYEKDGKGIIIQDNTGWIGLGECTDPDSGLCLKSSNSIDSTFNISVVSNTVQSCPYIVTQRFRGTYDTPDFLNNNDFMGVVAAACWDGTSSRIVEGLLCQATQNRSAGNLGNALRFYSVPNGGINIQHRMSIDQSGFVGIGPTNQTPSSMLDIQGDLELNNNDILQVTNINTIPYKLPEYAYLGNTTETNYSLVTIDQNYQVTDLVESESTSTTNFTYNAAPDYKLTYNGNGQWNSLHFHALCQVNKTCNITFHIEKNEASFIDFHENIFTSTGRYENLSTIKPIQLSNGDEIELYVSSDTANTTLTIHELDFLIKS